MDTYPITIILTLNFLSEDIEFWPEPSEVFLIETVCYRPFPLIATGEQDWPQLWLALPVYI
jgi:hypothetical protein